MPCPACASQDTQPYFTKAMPQRNYEIVRCVACGLLYLRDIPTADELTALYASPDYFESDECGYTTDYLKQRGAIEREAERRLARITTMLSSHILNRQLLDVGCAAGFFLAVAQKHGWRVQGVELSPDMAAHARQLLGAEIRPTLEPVDYALNSFDAITLWEVIEHLPAPSHTLNDIHRLLKPNGILAFSTPNTGHWHAQRKPEWWSEFKPPIHLVYFTEASLRALLIRAGFTDIRILRHRPLPIRPSTLRRLQQLRRLIGDGAEPRTPLWLLTSLLYRATFASVGLLHRWQHPQDDIYLGLEVYARKPQ